MRKFAIVSAGALVMTMVFSGCFIMRTLSYTDDAVKAGKETTAQISVSGDTTKTTGDDYPFFFVAAEGETRLANDGGRFDTESVFGGPVALKRNSALATAASEACEEAAPTPKRGIDDATAVTTNNEFNANNARKFMKAKVPIKVSETGAIDALGIFMGTWTDDGDGTPEDEATTDDAYDCQPPYVSAIKIIDGAPVR